MKKKGSRNIKILFKRTTKKLSHLEIHDLLKSDLSQYLTADILFSETFVCLFVFGFHI